MKNRYYQAISKVEKPFISWLSVGDYTEEEFAASSYSTDPLVVKEADVPPYNFGVSTVKIVSRELVPYSPAEMAVFEAEFLVLNKLKSNRQSLDVLELSSFDYDGQSFPMDTASRLFYSAFEKTRGNQKLMTMTGALYNLNDSSTNIDDFLAAYYLKLKIVTQPDV